MDKIFKGKYFSASLSFLTVLFIISIALADVPSKINYQGYLEDAGGSPVTASIDLTFRLYTVASGGTAFWTETQTNVLVSTGIFSVLLGDVAPLDPSDFNTTDIYLGVQVGSDSEMTPRQPLTSTAFTFRAKAAEDIPNYDADNNGAIDNDKIDTGVSVTTIGSGNIDNTEFDALDNITGNIKTQLDAKGEGDMLKSTYDTNDDGEVDGNKVGSGINAANIGTGGVSDTVFGYLAGVTSGIQFQLDAKGEGDMLKSTYDTNDDGAVDGNKVGSGINAANIGSGGVSDTVFGYLSGVTSGIQSQLDAKGDMLKSTYDTNDDGEVDGNKVGSGINAANIGTGGVSNTVFGYLTGVTSGIQAQLDAKGDMLKSTYDTNNDGAVDGNKVGSGINAANIGTGGVSNTVFGYLTGVTSGIQSQIDTKGDMLKSTYDTNNDGAVDGDKVGGGINAANIGTGGVSNDVFGYLTGVTSGIQSQLSAKVASVSGDTDKGIASSGSTSVSLGLKTTGCNAGDVMTFDGTNWNCAAPSGGGSSFTLTKKEADDTISVGQTKELKVICDGTQKVLNAYCYQEGDGAPEDTGMATLMSIRPLDASGNYTTDVSQMHGFSCQYFLGVRDTHIYALGLCY